MKGAILLLLFCFALDSAAGVGLARGLYCGYEDCYDVIGISRDNFTKPELSKLYRKLARVYHPDRVKDKSKVEESEVIFRLITTAYETLKDDETRKYYDYYLDHPEERYYNYYQYYRMAAPKVDVRYVIVGTILFISTIQYLSAVQKHSEALSYANTQPKFRNQAMEIARERGLLEFDPKTGKIKKKQKTGVDPDKIISSIIEENINVSGGYKPASLKNTLLWVIITSPLYFPQWAMKRGSLAYRQYKDLELTHEDKVYLIRRNLDMSADQFEALDADEVKEYFELKLWIPEAYTEYKKKKEVEEKERLASSGRYKQYKRFMRRNAGSSISFLEE
uniref:J domain-containing protein n=1 Tax=Panagrellus redivivus TaxID=6233 RepID=A0A7E4V8R4_PANRE